MRSTLAQNTAQLPLASGHYRELPRNTADAITSGCLQAQLGAIERMYAALAEVPGAVCLITGGAAQGLPRLRPTTPTGPRLLEETGAGFVGQQIVTA